ncbi:hypothetical protein CDV31_014633 [Fusarium ambrosium]|uniref:Uncharacterized protein n=1 Tax=Fusarium ambrosium TaxID=131363 RepID=A0A428SVA3_9HYPO|nr:hypothetical protein CDV31_014633 [Fusarium ambrosium]
MTKACMSLLVESLRVELAPFDIIATVVEPGYFRTNFLNPDVRVMTPIIDAYDENTPTGQMRKALEKMDGNQLGDVKKGCAVIVDVLTHSGVGEGRQVPVRICPGSDSDVFIWAKCDDTVKLLDEWKEMTLSTDHTD